MSIFQRKQVIKTLSGSAFKIFYTLMELTVKRYRVEPNFDGWIAVSYNQLRQMTGVQAINRYIDELDSEAMEGVIEIRAYNGTSNRYRISKEIIDERMEL